MPYCQNCGAEVTGNFCPNCGTQAGVYNRPQENVYGNVYENAKIVPRYSAVHCVLAGWPGFTLIWTTLVMLGVCVAFIVKFSQENLWGDPLAQTLVPIWGIVSIGLIFVTYLFFRPGLKSIRKYTPKEAVGKTTRSFLLRSFLFILCLGLTLMGCVYIIGIFLRVWRLVTWATTPRVDEYTAIVNGENIAVVKYIDPTLYGDGQIRYIYKDKDSNVYRPPLC